MAIPESFISELKSRVDIEEVIGSYVRLRRQGSNLVGLCPFHGEKTPSFTVFTSDQHYYCFGCGAGGDVITFIRAVENLEYPEAVRFLADRAGLRVPETLEDAGAAKLRSDILAANKEAARFFHMSLEGSPAEAYIEKRQLTPATVTRYGLGYAPENWDSLLTHMKKHGFDEPLLRRAGLAAVGQSGKYYDLFRGRLMFPIIDVRGDVIAFGGRVLGDGTPKYLNTPDTPAFKKSRSLFSLNFAKSVRGDRLILAEGYMDVIAMNQAGFAETVATLGTALTADQAKLMSRYVKEVVIAYDTDEAGRKATERAIGILSGAGLKARVLRYEGAKDPDEYIKTFGAAGLRRKLDSSSTSIDYQIEQAAAGKNLAEPDDKVEYLKAVAVILAGVGSPVAADVYAGRVSAEMKVDKQSLLTEVARLAAAARKKEAAKEVTDERRRITAGPSRVNPQRAANLKVSRAEEGIISLLFASPEYLAKLEGQLTEDDFATEFNKKIFVILKNVIESGGVPDISDFSDLEMSEIGAIAGMIALKEQLAGTIDELLQFTNTIRHAKSRRELSSGDPEALKKYLESLQK